MPTPPQVLTAQHASQLPHLLGQVVRSSFPLDLTVFITSVYQHASLCPAAGALLVPSYPTG